MSTTATRNPTPGKTGRPKLPADQRRDDFVRIRVSAAEKARFMEKAGANGMDVSEWLRRLGNGHKPRPPATQIDTKLLGELNAIGVNLNQIARALNRGREAPAPIEDVATELRFLLDKVANRL